MKDAVTRHEIVQQMERHSKSFWLQEQERQRAQVFGFELPIQVTYVAPLVYVGTDFVESILGKVRAANHGR
jgi:hypothetical protein